MLLSVALLPVFLVAIMTVDCDESLVSSEEENKFRSVQNVLKRSAKQGEIIFCDIGCVLYDPNNRHLIDDPGRNFHDTFSVISTSCVIEVVGAHPGLSRDSLRVMVSDRDLGRIYERTSASLETSGGRLVLGDAELVQRITFNLHACATIKVDSETRGEFVARIPQVVTHVVFLHNFRLDLGGEEVTGVVTVEASDSPKTLEVGVVRLEDGRCWMKPLDSSEFENYMLAVRVRSNDRHVTGMISTRVQTHLEDSFPFELYMEEINEFAFRFLEESLLQTRNVVKKCKTLIELCTTILRDHEEPKSSERPPDLDEEKLPPIVVSIGYRNNVNKTLTALGAGLQNKTQQ